MTSVADPLSSSGKAKCLLVMMPGVGDRAASFREQGFVDAIRGRGLSVDLIAADATVGYYLRGVVAQRLERDVLSGARARGYQQVWLLGISMGGFGALHFASVFPGQLDGVAAFAPHLGEETVLQRIRDAGGLEKWRPPVLAAFDDRNDTEQTWAWLRSVAVEKKPGPLVYLGSGKSDALVGNAGLLAPFLPPAQVLRVRGGHAWVTWRRLLEQFLETSEFSVRCAGS
jgi:S-formylglutathione hydrolase FrmB